MHSRTRLSPHAYYNSPAPNGASIRLCPYYLFNNSNKYSLPYSCNFDHILIMKPTIGKRAALYKSKEEKKPSPIQHFVETNPHHNIVLKRRFMYEEDAKEAININTLVERINLKRWFIKQLESNKY